MKKRVLTAVYCSIAGGFTDRLHSTNRHPSGRTITDCDAV